MKRTAKKERADSKVRVRIHRSVRGRVVTATEAARSFSNLLDRVQFRGESFVVERGGDAVCEIAPVGPPSFRLSDLIALVSAGPKPDAEFSKTIERAARKQPLVAPSPWER